ncbi:hypothetical protein BaRGS_00020660, partial [Batillaria attramentaria]
DKNGTPRRDNSRKLSLGPETKRADNSVFLASSCLQSGLPIRLLSRTKCRLRLWSLVCSFGHVHRLNLACDESDCFPPRNLLTLFTVVCSGDFAGSVGACAATSPATKLTTAPLNGRGELFALGHVSAILGRRFPLIFALGTCVNQADGAASRDVVGVAEFVVRELQTNTTADKTRRSLQCGKANGPQ